MRRGAVSHAIALTFDGLNELIQDVIRLLLKLKRGRRRMIDNGAQ